MARLSPQVLVQLTRRAVQKELKWKPTAQHAPPIPDGAEADELTAALAPLVMTVNGYGCLDEHTVYDETATIEGDTDHRGLLGRGYTCKLNRRLSPTRAGNRSSHRSGHN